MVTTLVAMDTGLHIPCVFVTTEVVLRVKSKVGFFVCRGNQVAVEKVKVTGRDL
jgi:hypothetical protein